MRGISEFRIGFIAARRESWAELQSRLAGAKGNLKLNGDVHIEFCPWCGTKLADFYQAYMDILVESGADEEFLQARTGE